jgi:hypothetical protein
MSSKQLSEGATSVVPEDSNQTSSSTGVGQVASRDTFTKGPGSSLIASAGSADVEQCLRGSGEGCAEDEAQKGLLIWMSNLPRGRIRLACRRRTPGRGRRSLKMLRAWLEQVKLGPAVWALLYLSVNDRGS